MITVQCKYYLQLVPKHPCSHKAEQPQIMSYSTPVALCYVRKVRPAQVSPCVSVVTAVVVQCAMLQLQVQTGIGLGTRLSLSQRRQPCHTPGVHEEAGV